MYNLTKNKKKKKMKENYLLLQEQWVKLNNITVGDKVRVVMSCPSRHLGWDNAWTEGMNNYIGQTIEVIGIGGVEGICFKSYHFPFFCLEKVKEEKFQFKLNDSYDVGYIKGQSYVSVGCQKIDVGIIRKVIEEVDKLNKS
jgi:hypothetical protein